MTGRPAPRGEGSRLCGASRPPAPERQLLLHFGEAAARPAPAPDFIAGLQSDANASRLFMSAVRARRIRTIRNARVQFRPFRATLYSYRIEDDGVARVRFHCAFRAAGDRVLLQAAHLMLARGRQARSHVPREALDRFVKTLPKQVFDLPGARRGPRRASREKGDHRSLAESFERVRERYFEEAMEPPELCWSPRNARRILGSYNEDDDRLIVSRVFDSSRVPLYVLDYLMYHELLHKKLGIGRTGGGRRRLHGRDFKRLERRCHRYADAVAFLKRL